MSGEQVHEGPGVQHEHKHAEAVHSHLFPEGGGGVREGHDIKHTTHHRSEGDEGQMIQDKHRYH